MKRFLLFACFVTGIFAFGQTKLISFKSHSGSMKYFNTVLSLGKMDIVNHNLGMAPEPIIKTAMLDSVIFVDDTTSIMVTTRVCRDRRMYEEDPTVWS